MKVVFDVDNPQFTGLRDSLLIKRFRFLDENGNNFPDWERKKLGGVTYKTDKKNKLKHSLPIYSVSNVNGFVPQSEQFDNIDSNDRGYDTSLYKIVEHKTFVYNPARINVGSIAYNDSIEKAIVSSLYVCFKTTDDIDDNFMQDFLQTSEFKASVLASGEGGVRIYLFYENFAEIKIKLPSYREQQKIGRCLYSLKNKLNNEIQILSNYQTQKIYLLKALFI